MNLNKLYFVTLFVLMAFSCKSPVVNFQDYDGILLTVGSGGGFSGIYNEYSLLKSGEVYKWNSTTKERTYVGKFEKKLAKQFFNNYKTLNFEKKNINNPGNMNYYIKFDDRVNEYKLLWSKTVGMDSNVLVFYKTFMQKINMITKR